jgi:hypothetical protein
MPILHGFREEAKEPDASINDLIGTVLLELVTKAELFGGLDWRQPGRHDIG